MRDFAEFNTWKTAADNPRRFMGVELSGWNTFLFGIAIGFATIYFGITQPTVREIAELREQIQVLQSSVREVADRKDVLEHTNGLLGLLEEQGRTAASAAVSLEHITALHERIQQQAQEIEGALAALDTLEQLKNSVLQSAQHAREAAAVLPLIGWINDQLIGEQVRNDQAQQSLVALEQLRDGLIDRSSGVDAAQLNLDKMIALKDAVIARTSDLVEATETLDLLTDVQVQLNQAVKSVGRMQHWAVEILAFEPTFNRAMRTLQPLAELGNLRHLGRDELRHVVRNLNDQRKELRTAGEVELAPTRSDVSDPVEDVPSVAERASAE